MLKVFLPFSVADLEGGGRAGARAPSFWPVVYLSFLDPNLAQKLGVHPSFYQENGMRPLLFQILDPPLLTTTMVDCRVRNVICVL